MSLISGNVTFGADAINCSSSSILGAAAFIDTASNQGTVSLASFSDTAVNEGTVVSAVFGDGAVNVGSLTSGTFLGTAVNSGVVDVAEFFGTASNVGVIVEAAKFADTSSNVGVVSGSAIFADTSVSNGIVEGAVQIAQTATQGESQTLTETPTEYTQTDGFFPNAHYSGAVKAAPANYATVVHQVGGFWYKYDANGDGSLASGNYSDGTSAFTFVNGVKGLAGAAQLIIRNVTYYYLGAIESGITILFTDEQLTTPAANIIFEMQGNGFISDNSGLIVTYLINQISSYFWVGQFGTFGTGKVLFTESTLENLATSLAGVDVGDINNDTYNDFVSTDANGVVTDVTYGAPSYDPDGTFIRNQPVYLTINGTSYQNGTEDILADGSGGERSGTFYPETQGVEFGRQSYSVNVYSFSLSAGDIIYLATGSQDSNDYAVAYSAEDGDYLGDVDSIATYFDGNGGWYQ